MIVSFDSQMLCESLMWAWYAAEEVAPVVFAGECSDASFASTGAGAATSCCLGCVDSESLTFGMIAAAFGINGCNDGSHANTGCTSGSFGDN